MQNGIAKNTVLLYFRMLLILLIGLFTSRVILHTLGVDDYGTYGVVAGVVTMFTIITNSISTAIVRFITFGLGKGDKSRLKNIFSTSLLIQVALCVVVVILTETVGLWYLHNKAVIPDGRMEAAQWVLQCSMGVLILSLFSVPYNATIIAHEKMGAFAYISILEAALKLSVAALVYFSPADKLVTYAVLLLVVAFITRSVYALYCHRHFEETRSGFVFDKTLVKDMFGFAGWSFFGSSAFVLNTQGMNLLTNAFFGVSANAARLLATQIEGIVKPFASNFMTAMNPQITKSYAVGDYKYTFDLVCKGAKFTYLILLLFAVPVFFEADKLLYLWQGSMVPQYSADFLRLTIIGVMADMTGNSLLTMAQATGKIRTFYICISIVAYLGLPLAWILFKMGYSPVAAYYVFIAVYVVVLFVKLAVVKRLVDFPVGTFLKDVLLKVALVTVPAVILTWIPAALMDDTFLRLCIVAVVSTVSIAGFTYLFALDKDEKEYLLRKVLKR